MDLSPRAPPATGYDHRAVQRSPERDERLSGARLARTRVIRSRVNFRGRLVTESLSITSMSYAIEFGLVFLVVVLAGHSLRRKGRLSAAMYRNLVIVVGLPCAIGILLDWYANHRRREVRGASNVGAGGLMIADPDNPPVPIARCARTHDACVAVEL